MKNKVSLILWAILWLQAIIGFIFFAFINERVGAIIGALVTVPFAALFLWMFLTAQCERLDESSNDEEVKK